MLVHILQRNKGNATTHPQHHPTPKLMWWDRLRMCSGISLASLGDVYWHFPCLFTFLRSMCRPSLNLIWIFYFFINFSLRSRNDDRRQDLRPLLSRYNTLVMASTVGKFNMTAGKWKGGWKGHGRDANGAVVFRHCLSFPPYYTRGICRANIHCYNEVITDGLELHLSTPASNFSKDLQIFIKCDVSTWHVIYPVSKLHWISSSNMLLSWRWCSSLTLSWLEICCYHLVKHHMIGNSGSSRSSQHQ